MKRNPRTNRGMGRGPLQSALSWISLWVLVSLAACSPSGEESEATARVTTPAVSSAPAADRETTPTLFRVGARGAENKGALYLLGSIHVGPNGGWRLPKRVLEAFEASDALVVEVHPEGESAEQQDDLTLSFGMLPIGTKVSEKISPDLYSKLREHLKETGQPIMGLDQLKPWMIAIALISNEFERLGYSPIFGVDVALLQRAAAKNKVVIALETTRQQLMMLDGMPESMQELMLRDALLQADEIESYFRALKGAWQRGDQPELSDTLFRELGDHPELVPFYDRVIFARNATMQARLEELLAQGGQYFVVVGAAHLAGKRGIPSALEAAGYPVQEIATKARN